MNMFTLGYGDLRFSSPFSRRGVACSCSSSTSLEIVKTVPDNWSAFSRRVSGEWSGIGVDFDGVGKPVELPSVIVPHRFRRWGLKLFDWETYCASVATDEHDSFTYFNKTFRLRPSLHHRALNVSIHNTEERRVTSAGKGGFLAFHPTGAYVAVWQNSKVVEHCLVDENQKRTRSRILHRFKRFGEIVITVFKEKWEDEYQEGKTVESFLTQHPGLCSSSRLRGDELSGAWEVARSSFIPAEGISTPSSIHELTEEKSNAGLRRDESGFVPLPRGFWSAVKNVGDELDIEGGWLISPGIAVASRCRITSSGQILKVELETQRRTG